MDRVVAWRELCAQIEPVYPRPADGRRSACSGCSGCNFLQHWFNFSDPAVEEALYDSSVSAGGRGGTGDLLMMRKRLLRLEEGARAIEENR
jgi:hypothetical protein